jgi:hypothetical protein
MEATQSSNLCLDEDDVEGAINEGCDVDVDSTPADDVDGIPLIRHDSFSISSANVSPSRGTLITQSPPYLAIVPSVPVIQESPQSPEVAEVQVHPSLLEENEHHEVPSE